VNTAMRSQSRRAKWHSANALRWITPFAFALTLASQVLLPPSVSAQVSPPQYGQGPGASAGAVATEGAGGPIVVRGLPRTGGGESEGNSWTPAIPLVALTVALVLGTGLVLVRRSRVP
jgi:hypothetical protein